jgi:hypothetical protein
MSGSTAKKIKKIIGFGHDDPIVRRKYRAIKKEYSKLDFEDRRTYISNLTKLFNN